MPSTLSIPAHHPWKRWNVKGSASAKQRMKELRERKDEITKSLLIDEWVRATGRNGREWWADAQAAGLTCASSTRARIDFLRAAIAEARAES